MGMEIQVRTALYVTKILGGRSITVEIPEPSTLNDLLRELTDIYGQEFYDAVCNEDGYDDGKTAILVNGTSAAAIGGVSIPLKNGDDVLIMPIISGG